MAVDTRHRAPMAEEGAWLREDTLEDQWTVWWGDRSWPLESREPGITVEMAHNRFLRDVLAGEARLSRAHNELMVMASLNQTYLLEHHHLVVSQMQVRAVFEREDSEVRAMFLDGSTMTVPTRRSSTLRDFGEIVARQRGLVGHMIYGGWGLVFGVHRVPVELLSITWAALGLHRYTVGMVTWISVEYGQ